MPNFAKSASFTRKLEYLELSIGENEEGGREESSTWTMAAPRPRVFGPSKGEQS